MQAFYGFIDGFKSRLAHQTKRPEIIRFPVFFLSFYNSFDVKVEERAKE